MDRSRAPQLAEGVRWDDCPFPEEAEQQGLDSGTVLLRVEVAPDGAVRSVKVVSASDGGFAREATRCARTKHWLPGLDRSAQPAAATALVSVRFQRRQI